MFSYFIWSTNGTFVWVWSGLFLSINCALFLSLLYQQCWWQMEPPCAETVYPRLPVAARQQQEKTTALIPCMFLSKASGWPLYETGCWTRSTFGLSCRAVSMLLCSYLLFHAYFLFKTIMSFFALVSSFLHNELFFLLKLLFSVCPSPSGKPYAFQNNDVNN